MADTTGAGHGGLNAFDKGAGARGRNEWTEVEKINSYFLTHQKSWKDVTDRAGRTVSQNLVNIVNNTNRIGKAFERTLSHHMNAFNGKATGVEVWYYAGDMVMKAQAEKVSAAIAKALGLVNRGAKATTSLYVVSNTVSLALLIEWCFIDNPNDMKAWDKNRVKAMNAAMVALGLKAPGTTTPAKPKPKPAKTTWYHSLVVGWFTKGSSGHKDLVAFAKKNGMQYKEIYVKNKVWLYLVFSQASDWKTTMENFLKKKNWQYFLVKPGQEKSTVDNW